MFNHYGKIIKSIPAFGEVVAHCYHFYHGSRRKILGEDNLISLYFKSLTIGKNSIIGAGSIVTKDISENCLAVGIPAQVKKLISPG